MNFKYHSLPRDEKLHKGSCDLSSTGRGSLDAPLLDAEIASRSTERPSSRWQFSSHWIWLVHAVMLLASFSMFSAAYFIQLSTLRHVQQFSAYSPAASSIEYQTVKFNITTKGNRFVGAGPDVDKAWREISYDVGDQMITPSELSKLDMPKSSLKVTHPQTGVEGYRVGIEAFHQLHCINLLRRVTYKDYYEPLGGEFAAGPAALQQHTDHCLEVLRLNTQCNADIGLFTFYMVPGDPLAWPELNSWHKCRNFERVRDWAVDHSVGNMENNIQILFLLQLLQNRYQSVSRQLQK